VYFRVSAVYRNMKICVYDGEKKIFEKKKAKLAPGEMEMIRLKGESLPMTGSLLVALEEV